MLQKRGNRYYVHICSRSNTKTNVLEQNLKNQNTCFFFLYKKITSQESADNNCQQSWYFNCKSATTTKIAVSKILVVSSSKFHTETIGLHEWLKTVSRIACLQKRWRTITATTTPRYKWAYKDNSGSCHRCGWLYITAPGPTGIKRKLHKYIELVL